MSRQRMSLDDGRLLVVGWDEPFQTWYAVLYDGRDENAPPAAVIGYAPDEQAILRAERPDAVIGPYPVGDEHLERMLETMIPEFMGLTPMPSQPMCHSCGKPPWQPGEGCAAHPYDRLKAVPGH